MSYSFNQMFEITKIGPTIERTGKDNKPYHQRVLLMRNCADEPQSHPHAVLFSRGSLNKIDNLTVGQKVMLEYKLTCTISKQGIHHTHINPLKVTPLNNQ